MSDVETRYTWQGGDLYATALGWPGDKLSLAVPARADPDGSPDAALLTADGDVSLDVSHEGDRLTISLPERPDHEYAYTLRLSDVPQNT